MKFLKQGVCLALLGAGLAAVPGTQLAADAAAAAPGKSLVQQMKDGARGSVTTSASTATGKLDFARSGTNGDLMPASSGTPAAKATAYLQKYAGAFGAAPDQLKQDSVVADAYGTTVTYTQSYRGIPVFAGLIRAHVDKDGDLTAVNGFAAPDINISTTPARSASAAASRAIAFVKSSPTDGVKAGALKATMNDLVVYRTGAIKNVAGTNVLAYVVQVTDGNLVRENVFVDASSGKVINRYTMVDNDLDRELQEAFVDDAGTPDDGTDDFVGFDTVWQEGDAFPGDLNIDQQNLVNTSAESYWFFKNGFNRDSYDGDGAKRITVNNDPRIQCPNANWNGQTTNYCDGVTSDDVVGHEWGHAYTEYTWGGIYQWQSGALNEAYSDIYGETLDLINGREDEDEGDINAKRPDGLCSSNSPALPQVKINAPASIAKFCDNGAASFGPPLDAAGKTGDVVAAVDPADGSGPTPDDACSPLTNAAAIAGKIALVKRGTCGFTVKVKNAQDAGAIAVLVQDNVEAFPSGLGGADETITIPSVRIRLSDGDLIRTALTTQPVNVTMKDASGDDKSDSFRWLIGEKSPAFGGAIRDMWNPTCYGDPGKVSDVEYKCSTDDQGGVHGNSGVPNHGYALLVDGGTFNDVTVEGIGLTKAMAIYFRAASVYQTPITNFADHADSLAASCADLTGKKINKLSTAPNDANAFNFKITAADCAQVDKMADAVELRAPAVQCDFQPQLDPNAPDTGCGTDTAEVSAFDETFEEGIADWSLDGESVFGGPTKPWVSTTELPTGNLPPGDETAAFGPAPDLGTCTNDAADFSSVNTMTSPDIVVGEAGAVGARLSFDHNIQTELGFDGGTVKISVNGGDFTTVPAAAYVFNGPSVLATEDAGNTNPLAGQDGFTGTDGGRILSDWGTSIVDLAGVGVAPGDTIKVQFAIGRDGCGGVEGWWVDNVKVSTCVEKATSTTDAVAVPASVAYGAARKVNVTVTGTTPTGAVTVKEGATTVGTGTLTAGAASISLPTTLAVGAHNLTVSYAGDAANGASSDTVTLTVTKAASTTTAVASPASVKLKKKFSAKVTVTSAGSTPTGTVQIFFGGVKVGTGTLSGGKVTIAVSKTFGSVGTKALVAKYLGSANVAASQKSFTVKVVK